MIDVVIKLTWSYTVFRALFEKKAADREVREAHPEFFLTMHDCLFCGFCVATSLLFEDKRKAISLRNLVVQAKPELEAKWNEKIRVNRSIKELEKIRQQVCAHRWQKKSPQEVIDEVRPRVKMMEEVVALARSIVLELVGAINAEKREHLEAQQLSGETSQKLADDTGQIMHAFLKPLRR